MKKLLYLLGMLTLFFLSGCNSNQDIGILDSSKFPLILTTVITKEDDLNQGTLTFDTKDTMIWKKDYNQNPNDSSSSTASKGVKELTYTNIKIKRIDNTYKVTGTLDGKEEEITFKLIEDDNRIEDSDGNIYGDFGGR